MNAKDHFKLIKAGFTIIRKEVTHIVSHEYDRKIKAKDANQTEWHTLEKGFKTTAELDRKMKDLLKNNFVVED